MFLTKYRPHRSVDSVFDLANFANFCAPSEAADKVARRPLTNIHENDTSFVLTMEVPGLDKADINVAVENDALVIGGERTEKVEEKGLLRREIRSTSFHRSFQIGDKIDRENIKAKLDHGVLTVTLSKTEEKVGRKVDID